MLFNDVNTCIAVLEDNGYIVIPPVKSPVKNYKGVVKYFYSKIKSRYNIGPSEFNWRNESLYAKTFVKQLSPTSKSTDSNALKQACMIIDALIDDIIVIEKYFRLTSLKLLIMENTSWLTEKAMRDIQSKVEGYNGMSESEVAEMNAAYSLYLDKQPKNTELLDVLNRRVTNGR